MTNTTFEEAKKCPKCGEPGAVSGEKRGREGRQVIIRCYNERCLWYKETCRIIDVREDGTIPDPDRHREKRFPKLPDRTKSVREQVDRQLNLETHGGGEVTRRF